MTIPFANADLKAVKNPPAKRTVEYESEGGGAGSTVWSGRAAVYYQEKRERKQNPEGAGGSASDVVIERYLFVESRSPLVSWAPDLIVEFTTVFGEDVTAIVTLARRADTPEVPSAVATTKLTLKLQ